MSVSILKMSFHCLPCIVCDKKFDVTLILVSLNAVCHFLAAFKLFFLVLVFNNLVMLHLVLFCCIYFCLGFSECLGTVIWLLFFICFRKFLSIVSSDVSPFFFFLFWISNYTYVRQLNIVSYVLPAVSCFCLVCFIGFYTFFSLCVLVWLIFINPSSGLLHLCHVCN